LSFIGRGETRVKYVLQSLFHDKATVLSQVHIRNVINLEDFKILGKEHNQHKFDLVITFHHGPSHPDIIVEVNYKHKVGAARKWTVYSRDIIKAGKIPLAVNDFECTSLFDTENPRALVWGDFIDVINVLKTARIGP